MGGFLEKPITDKYQDVGEGNGLRYGVASMQGWRVEMEDAHVVRIDLGPALPYWSYFAVFDGHAGAKRSTHCADHLLDAIMETGDLPDDVKKGIYKGFLDLDATMRTMPEHATDKSGTTAVCAFVSQNQIFVANCGDSRAVLCRAAKPVFTTEDHKPLLPSEKERIVAAGGSVNMQRINGSLAVSRALGDYSYKECTNRGPCEQLVSPEPEIFVRDRDDELDEFMVLACDGVWDVMTNDDICQFIHSRLLVTDNLQDVCSQVLDTCFHKGSHDNMSIVLVVFPGAPVPTPDAIEAERELDAAIERSMRDAVRDDENITAVALKTYTEQVFESRFPPGGGCSSKSQLIESIVRELLPDQMRSESPPPDIMPDPIKSLDLPR